MNNKKNISLFFTLGISLETWVNTGLIDREKIIYEEYIRIGFCERVFWFTYGSRDKKYEKELKESNRLHENIEVISMPKVFDSKIGKIIYSLLIPFVHMKILKDVDMLKTNQMKGSWSAVIAKWIYKRALILRTGYIASLFAKRRSKSRLKVKLYELMEKFAYKYSDIAIVASEQDKDFICKQYKMNTDKVKVIHNYIDVDLFHPIECKKYGNKIVYVGRLNNQKNLFNLISAIVEIDLVLDIYGKGELKEELVRFAKKLGAKVNFMGVIANSELPEILNRYKYYILPSLYEGMPKSLLEALACGLVCIGTNVQGINEVIEDEKNGYLAKTTNEEDVLEALKKATEADNKILAKNAIEGIKNRFSLSMILEKEQRIIEVLLRKQSKLCLKKY